VLFLSSILLLSAAYFIRSAYSRRGTSSSGYGYRFHYLKFLCFQISLSLVSLRSR
jgi:hypothetical protein